MKGEFSRQYEVLCYRKRLKEAAYIETNKTKVLLDAGISFPSAQKRVEEQNINLSEISAVIITHEHYDHVSFLPTVLKRTKADLYINTRSFEHLDYRVRGSLPRVKVKFLEADTRYKIGDLDVLTLQLSHDSANNFGYVFISGEKALMLPTPVFPLKYIELIKNVDVDFRMQS